MKMNNSSLSHLIEKWSSQLIVKASEFMLSPKQAIEFAEDLAKVDEIIMGCDGWRYVDKSKSWIVQDLAVGLSLDEYIPWDEMTPEKKS